MKKVSFLNLREYNKRFESGYDEVVSAVLKSGVYLNGEFLRSFEKEFSRFCNTKYCVGTANGLDALRLVLRAWIEIGILKEGQEVLVPANTFIATVLAVEQASLKPVLVEPDNDTGLISAELIRKHITDKTRVLIPVHLYGRIVDRLTIEEVASEYGLLVLDDCAQAHGGLSHGKRVGSHYDASAFSFYPGKILGALGDGGAITTNSKELADTVRMLSNYGFSKKYVVDYRGYNSRLDEVQAGFLLCKLAVLDENINRRRQLAYLYCNSIKNALVESDSWYQREECWKSDAWHLYVIKSNRRDCLKSYLSENGIETLIHYPIPIHQQKAYRGEYRGCYPSAENWSEKVLSLPMCPTLADSDIEYVSSVINSFRREG